MGYHLKEIAKGTFGDFSKVEEEMLELLDASAQGNQVMMLCEMSDLISAMRAYLKKHCGKITLQDLMKQADATERAFESGRRQ